MGRYLPTAKPWGRTTSIGNAEFAVIRKGWESSWHCHEDHKNLFFVIKGRLRIVQEVGGTVVLGPGDLLTVETSNRHKFRALQNTELIEVYVRPDIRRIRVT